MKPSHRITSISKMCAAGTLGLSMALTMGLPAVNASQVDPDLFADTPEVTGPLSETMKKAEGTVTVFVQFKGKGAFESTQPAEVLAGKQAPVPAQDAVQAIAATVKSQGEQVATQANADLLYTVHNSLRGAAITGDAEEIRALAKRSDVLRISPIVTKHLANGSSDVTTKALATWTQTGFTGKGVKIAVADTGVDYTHAAFGGPGTDEAYREAEASATMPEADSGLYDTTKYIGGWDFVGDAYTGSNTPQPDSNPLDCRTAGHGTHVAGTAAAYGVDAEGKTFRGDFKSLTEEQVLDMQIGPGSAPEAQIVGFRVFGCSGSTNVTGEALDRTLDPNGDGNFDDKVDIINLSLGADFGAHDDPENYIVEAIARQGVLTVAAAGNANSYRGVGDTYGVQGNPANATSSLSVANVIGAHAYFDKAVVSGPADLAGDVKGDYSVNFNYSTATPEQLTGEVVMVPANNRFACDAFPADVDFKGKWVFIDWEETPNSFPCGSAVRFNNLEKAGAKGVVLASVVTSEATGIAGNATIPGIRLSKDDAEKLRPAAEAGTLKITLSNEWRGVLRAESGNLDRPNPSTGRGQHGSKGFTKPDVAAPGTNIISAGVGLGAGPETMTGTSMATPHVAGIAALVAEANPSYTPINIKTAIMNSANNVVRMEDGAVAAIDRVGTGRVNALAAVQQDVMLYGSDSEEQVSVSFGVAEVDADADILTMTREFTVDNLGDKAHTYQIGIDQSVTMPGVTLEADKTVTVAPKSKAKFKVTVTIDPKKMDKTYDPAQLKETAGYARQYLASASGRVILTEGETTLRVPVHVAPKPVSKMVAEGDFAALKQANSRAEISFNGVELNQGQYKSMVGVFELGAVSDRIPSGTFAAQVAHTSDLQYVGTYSNAQELAEKGGDPNKGVLGFGISTWANWEIINNTAQLEISIDTNGDGTPDYYLATQRIAGLDYPIAQLYKRNPIGTLDRVGAYAINDAFGDIDTNIMDTNTMVIPVPLADLGLTAANARNISYKVDTYSWYGNEGPVDSTDWITYNPFAPNVAVSGGTKLTGVLFSDANGEKVTIKSTGRGLGALFLHMHNGTGDLTATVAGEDGLKAQAVLFAEEETAPNPLEENINDPRFIDVPADHPFFKEIAWLASRGITTGWSDGTFRPAEGVQRAAMAAFFYRLAGSPQFTVPSESPFKDVPTDHPFYKEITWMSQQGITTGWEDGTFRPAEPVSRAAMAAFFYRMAGKPEFVVPSHSPFNDVALGHPFYKEIAWMNASGLSNGWEDGSYRPATDVSRAAMAAFIYRYTDQRVNG